MLVHPAGQHALYAAGRRDHRILGIRVSIFGRHQETHLVEAVVAHVQPDQHQQCTTDPVDKRQDSPQVSASAELADAAATASTPTTSVKPAAYAR